MVLRQEGAGDQREDSKHGHDDRADELLAAEGIDTARHFLRSARRYRPHLLSEPEERIFSERALTGCGPSPQPAWTTSPSAAKR